MHLESLHIDTNTNNAEKKARKQWSSFRNRQGLSRRDSLRDVSLSIVDDLARAIHHRQVDCPYLFGGSSMGSVTRTAGGIAAAMLIQAGLAAAPSAAYAEPVVNVGCGPTKSTDLINAINAANTAGAGTLRLASSCNYILTAPAMQVLPTTRGPDGLPIISGNISLIGGRSTRISRPSTAAPFRIVEVAAGAVLSVRNIFISGGASGANTGGGILNARGNVLLTHTTVTDNTADNGAGISNDSGRMTLIKTLVSSNTALGGGGGGAYNDGWLNLRLSRFTGNSANTSGGGIYNGQIGGRTEAFRTTIDGNTARASGGGIFNASDARLALARTLVKRNTANNGGGIFNAGIANRVSFIDNLVILNTPNNCAPPNSVPGCKG
jgi:hypothetical protein